MSAPDFDAFLADETTRLYLLPDKKKTVCHLLWGDGVRLLGETSGELVKVRGRGRTGWIAQSALKGGRSLLEVYFIDVGQGDGVLIKTPDFRHLLIDAGHPRKSQNTGKSAADFVDWKFVNDYEQATIALDAMIASHNDIDHYGGLSDLLDVAQTDELDARGVTVETFFHAGVSWWRTAQDDRTLGRTRTSGNGSVLIDLLGDRASAQSALAGQDGRRLQGAWGEFIDRVVAARRSDGGPCTIARVSHKTGDLPGFAGGEGKVAIRTLGPVEVDADGAPALINFQESDSKATNGNSVLLRLDYGRARILLTGDLNKASQAALLKAFEGRRLEFACDVAKACHHGSEDVSFSFLQAMGPSATVISSGDGEGHDHPRPRIVAASGATGHLRIENDEVVTPLVYSTELARSVSLGHPFAVKAKDGVFGLSEDKLAEGNELKKLTVGFTETKPGALKASKREKDLSRTKVVAGLIYGLVNVRTDGDKILAATMDESEDGSWSVKTFRSRF